MPLGMMSDAGDLEVNRLPQQPVFFISILGFQHEIMFPNMFISAKSLIHCGRDLICIVLMKK